MLFIKKINLKKIFIFFALICGINAHVNAIKIGDIVYQYNPLDPERDVEIEGVVLDVHSNNNGISICTILLPNKTEREIADFLLVITCPAEETLIIQEEEYSLPPQPKIKKKKRKKRRKRLQTKKP